MNLKIRTVNSFIWNALGNVGGGIVTIGITMILARQLAPKDFGIIELIVIFTNISAVFVDSGFSKALIRDKLASQIDLSSVFWLNITVATLIYLVLFFIAPIITIFFNTEEYVWLFRYVFLVILFEASVIIQNAKFQKELKFKPIATVTVLSMSLAGVIAVVLAIYGYGIWALATNVVLFSFFKALFFWGYGNWKFSFICSKDSLKKYFGFGSKLLCQELVDKIVSNFESFVIGKCYTKQSLGYFSQARKLDNYIFSKFTSVIQAVTYPALTKLEISRLKSGYQKVITAAIFFTMPLAFFSFYAADSIIYCFFGKQWDMAVPYFRLWTIVSFFVNFYTFFINSFLVLGKSNLLLKYSLIRQCLRVFVILITLQISIITMLYGIMFVTIISWFLYVYNAGKLLDYKMSEIFKDIFPTFLASLLATFLVVMIVAIIPNENILYKFLLQVCIMLFSYVMINVMIKNPAYYEMRTLLYNILKRK